MSTTSPHFVADFATTARSVRIDRMRCDRLMTPQRANFIVWNSFGANLRAADAAISCAKVACGEVPFGILTRDRAASAIVWC